MQRKTFAALALAGCAFSSSAAAAADNIYVGGNISRQSIESGSIDFNVVSVLAGYKFSDYWSLEARAGTGVSDDDSTFYTFEGENYQYHQEIEWQASINFRGAYSLTSDLSVFGIVGYTETEMGTSSRVDGSARYSGSYDITGVNYGAGLQYKISDKFSASLEYQFMPELYDDQDWDSLALGVQYHF